MGFRDRLFGLLGRKKLLPFQGMYFPHCSAIHTCFMRMSISVIFCDEQGYLLKLYNRVPPWRFLYCRGARGVFEFSAWQFMSEQEAQDFLCLYFLRQHSQ